MTLVDTRGQGVGEIIERGVVVDGEEYELDCLIYATGFEVGTEFTRRAGYEIIGRADETLSSKWAEGLSTFHGFLTRGFPNCFFMGVTQTGFTPNFPHMLNEQSKHIAYIIEHALSSDVNSVEASEEAEADWVSTIRRLRRMNQQFFLDCTPGYYNNEGQPNEGQSLLDGMYGGGPEEFFKILREWRSKGDLQGLELA